MGYNPRNSEVEMTNIRFAIIFNRNNNNNNNNDLPEGVGRSLDIS